MKHLVILCCLTISFSYGQKAFPGLIPTQKPDRPMSEAMHRMYDQWNPHEDRGNELYSNFKYSSLNGFNYPLSTSRRDPSKVLKIEDTYFVWYTKRHTTVGARGPKRANDTIPSADWDLCEIWYATSKDGFNWKEQKAAIKRPKKGDYGWRSVSTPDILIWKGKYYLYYQGFNEIPLKRGDRAAVTVAEADSPHGPWKASGRVIIDFGKEDEWDANAIHDPYPIVYKGKIYLYYKGSPIKTTQKELKIIRAQGLAIASDPYGPFEKHPLNPVINSGHETCMFPFKNGVAAIVSLDGPEKNTIQFAEDGVNFRPVSHIQMPPIAPGPFVKDAFADNADGKGITWGLMHVNIDEPSNFYTKLMRFDCDLSLEVDWQKFKQNNLRHNEAVYLQKRIRLNNYYKKDVLADDKKVNQNTLIHK